MADFKAVLKVQAAFKKFICFPQFFFHFSSAINKKSHGYQSPRSGAIFIFKLIAPHDELQSLESMIACYSSVRTLLSVADRMKWEGLLIIMICIWDVNIAPSLHHFDSPSEPHLIFSKHSKWLFKAPSPLNILCLQPLNAALRSNIWIGGRLC